MKKKRENPFKKEFDEIYADYFIKYKVYEYYVEFICKKVFIQGDQILFEYLDKDEVEDYTDDFEKAMLFISGKIHRDKSVDLQSGNDGDVSFDSMEEFSDLLKHIESKCLSK